MNFDIGLTGLRAAQQTIELIGTNIANAATPGYHRQEVLLAPLSLDPMGETPSGGVQVAACRQTIDTLLEDTILRQRPAYEQLTQELNTLHSLEASLGSLNSQALTDAINSFFGSLRELSTDPGSQALRQQAVWAADSLAASFRHLGGALTELKSQTLVEARIRIDEVNSLTAEIADLNQQVEVVAMRGGNANLLADQRDQLIHDLSGIVELATYRRLDGSKAVDVYIDGVPVVVKDDSYALDVDPVAGGKLGLTREGSDSYHTDIQGGKLGGLFSLRNDLLAEIHDEIDNLAEQIMQEVNRVQFQGVGSAGSFSALNGRAVANETDVLANWDDSIAAGSMRLRLIDPAGQATAHSIPVDPDTDTLVSLAAALAAVDPAHLTASVVSGHLHMEGLDDWTFDFLPAADLAAGPPWTGTAEPTISGVCTASANDTLTCTVQGGGQVGVDEDLRVEVRNAAGELVTTLNVGRGHVAAEPVELCEGLALTFPVGTLTAGESFTIDVVADSDPTGFLPAAGMNTLFQGEGAADMRVRQEVLDDPALLATARGADGADNLAVRRMAELGETQLAGLGDVTPTGAFGLIVTGIGQRIAVREIRQESLQSVMRQLENQRDATSGVDINEEAAKLLVFEQMYQGMAKFLQTQQEAMQTLVNIL